MSAPPGTLAPPELFGEQITDARIADLGTANGRMRFLVRELGITRAQARRLMVAYAADLADAAARDRIGNDSGRSDSDFLDWLLRQAPGGRKPSVAKWQIGQAAWRVRS